MKRGHDGSAAPSGGLTHYGTVAIYCTDEGALWAAECHDPAEMRRVFRMFIDEYLKNPQADEYLFAPLRHE